MSSLGVAQISAVVGSCTAGGAYVPLDPAYPKERITYMIEDAGVAFLLSGIPAYATVNRRLTLDVAAPSHDLEEPRAGAGDGVHHSGRGDRHLRLSLPEPVDFGYHASRGLQGAPVH